MKRTQFLWNILILFYPLCFPSTASAWDHVLRTNVTAYLGSDASLTVHENTLFLANEGESQNFLVRNIPFSYEKEKINDVKFWIKSATIDGREVKFDISRLSDGVEIYLKDNITLSAGVHVFNLNYTLTNQVLFQEKYDALSWVVTGNDPSYSTEKIFFKVLLPNGASIQRCNVLKTFFGDRIPSRDWEISDDKMFETTKALKHWETLTVFVSWPKGFITPFSNSARKDLRSQPREPIAGRRNERKYNEQIISESLYHILTTFGAIILAVIFVYFLSRDTKYLHPEGEDFMAAEDTSGPGWKKAIFWLWLLVVYPLFISLAIFYVYKFIERDISLVIGWTALMVGITFVAGVIPALMLRFFCVKHSLRGTRKAYFCFVGCLILCWLLHYAGTWMLMGEGVHIFPSFLALVNIYLILTYGGENEVYDEDPTVEKNVRTTLAAVTGIAAIVACIAAGTSPSQAGGSGFVTGWFAYAILGRSKKNGHRYEDEPFAVKRSTEAFLRSESKSSPLSSEQKREQLQRLFEDYRNGIVNAEEFAKRRNEIGPVD